MYSLLCQLFLLALTTTPSLTHALSPSRPPRIQEIFSYPATNPIFLENILTLPDGRLLLSHFPLNSSSNTTPGTTPVLLLDPSLPSPSPQVIVTLPGNVTDQTGLASLGQHRYAITAGIFAGLTYLPGTVHTFIISLLPNAPRATVLYSIPAPPNTVLMNGLAALPDRASSHILLSADSGAGSILRINTLTRKTDTVLRHPLLGHGNHTILPLGVNGLRVQGSFLYFTNTALGFFGRVRINPVTGDISPSAQIEVVARIGGGETGFENAFDDFTLDSTQKNVYVTRHSRFLVKINLASGRQEIIVGGGEVNNDDGVVLKAPTAVALGPGGRELFVTTAGQVNGVRVGGQVVRVRI